MMRSGWTRYRGEVLGFVARRLHADRAGMVLASREKAERAVVLTGLPDLTIRAGRRGSAGPSGGAVPVPGADPARRYADAVTAGSCRPDRRARAYLERGREPGDRPWGVRGSGGGTAGVLGAAGAVPPSADPVGGDYAAPAPARHGARQAVGAVINPEVDPVRRPGNWPRRRLARTSRWRGAGAVGGPGTRPWWSGQRRRLPGAGRRADPHEDRRPGGCWPQPRTGWRSGRRRRRGHR